jgi:hypothetical protein
MNLVRGLAIAAVVVSVSSLGGTPASASTLRHVAPGGSDSGNCSVTACATIAYAIGQAADADTISLAAGTYTENLSINTRHFTITGPTSGAPAIIDGNNASRVLSLGSSSITLSYLTVQHGSTEVGGGISIVSSSGLILDHVVVTDNHAVNVAHDASGNGFPAEGGGIYSDSSSSLVISSSTISNNSALGANGIDGPTSGGQGGEGHGGGIYTVGSLTVSTTTFSGNTAQGGYGDAIDGSDGGNGGQATGGAVLSEGNVPFDITTSMVRDNQAIGGAGGSSRGAGAPGAGGFGAGAGLYFSGYPQQTVSNSTFFHNGSIGGGGGSFVASINPGNGGKGGFAVGGGMRMISPGRLTNVTISDNIAQGGAGGTGDGGGSNGANGVGSGGGIDGAPTMDNSIVVNNLAGGNCDGTPTASVASDNLQWPGTSCGSSMPSHDAALASPASNGGPTQTMALNTGSVAIDAGDDNVCSAAPVSSVDQRLFTRPVGAHCDIGAFEGTAGTTAARIVGFTARQTSAGTQFKWRVAEGSGLIGFAVYAGSRQVSSRTIRVHAARGYVYRHAGRVVGPYFLHVLLRDGGTRIVSTGWRRRRLSVGKTWCAVYSVCQEALEHEEIGQRLMACFDGSSMLVNLIAVVERSM